MLVTFLPACVCVCLRSRCVPFGVCGEMVVAVLPTRSCKREQPEWKPVNMNLEDIYAFLKD